MKQDQNLRFVIIGMGYLMEYIAPCYSKLLGDKKAEQMLGVTAEPQAVQTKAKATGIPVILNDNAGALRRMEPDIILFAPPPSLAAPLTESVLVPYFAECRAAGKELPMPSGFDDFTEKARRDYMGGDPAARANAKRRCMPPEKVPTRSLRRPDSPTRSRTSSIRCCRSLRGARYSRAWN